MAGYRILIHGYTPAQHSVRARGDGRTSHGGGCNHPADEETAASTLCGTALSDARSIFFPGLGDLDSFRIGGSV
jgi:hypothetical protein